MHDTDAFKVISLLLIYIFLKEKYNSKINNEFNQKDLEKIQILLLRIDKYAHIPQRNSKEKFQICSIVSFAMDKNIFKHT